MIYFEYHQAQIFSRSCGYKLNIFLRTLRELFLEIPPTCPPPQGHRPEGVAAGAGRPKARFFQEPFLECLKTPGGDE